MNQLPKAVIVIDQGHQLIAIDYSDISPEPEAIVEDFDSRRFSRKLTDLGYIWNPAESRLRGSDVWELKA